RAGAPPPPPAAARTNPGTRRGAPGAPATPRDAAPGGSQRSCREEEAPRRQRGHAQQEPPVGEAADVRRAVGTFAVAHRNLEDAEVELRGPEDQVEVAVRIEVAEVGTAGREMGVVLAPENLGAAERVLDG